MVLEDVLLEFVAPGAGVVAVLALEGFVGEVDALVSDEVGLLDEGARAEAALERSHRQVRPQMRCQLRLKIPHPSLQTSPTPN